MPQAVNRWPPTAGTQLLSQASACDTFDGHSGNGTDFSRILRSSSFSVIPPMLHTPLHLHAAVTSRIKMQSLGTLKKINSLLEIEEHCIA